MSENTYPLIADDYRYYAQPVQDVYLEETAAQHTPFQDKTTPIVDEDAGVIAYAHESLAPFIAESLSSIVFIRQALEKQAMEGQDPIQALADIAAIIEQVEKLNAIDIEVVQA